jgi:tRNA threonylcarbamoyl adenosine modification protein YeaZ
MKVLAFDVTAQRLTVGIADGDRVLGRWDAEARRDRGTSLDRLIDQALSDVGWSRASIEGLGLVTGPGSLTATRIGWATASGWAAAQDIPVTGWTTPEVQRRWYAHHDPDGREIAQNDRSDDLTIFCVVHNRGAEFYCYELDPETDAVDQPSVIAIDHWQPPALGEIWLVGPGLLDYRARWEKGLADRARIAASSYEIVGGDQLARWAVRNLTSDKRFSLSASPLDYGLPPDFRRAS